MRQLCPYCGTLVELPDDAAGRETPCPSCAKPFAVPKAYTPTVSQAPPSVSAEHAPAAPPPVAAPATPGECTLTLSPKVIAWIPAAALTIALISVCFFSWVVSFPAGQRVFAQSPVQAIGATFSRTTIASVQDQEKGLDAAIRTNWLMIPFLVALVVAVTYAWLERVFPEPTVENVPAFLAPLITLWPRRHLLLIALCGFCLALIVLQDWRGFGLETAANDYAASLHAKERETADTAFKDQEVRIKIGQDVGKFCLDDTLASHVGLAALTLALLAAVAHWWLTRRGDRPAPQIILKH